MNKIYVTGHRNPDTDSVVSAMAYAALRNATGDREYVAARLGHLSDETKLILNRFGFEPPLFIKNMRTQVMDLDFDTPPILNRAVTVNRAWSAMEEDKHISAIPVTDDDGHLLGMLTAGDIAAYDMHTIADPTLREVPLFNILSVLEGQLLSETDEMINTITGEVILALPQGTELPPYRAKETVLICGHQPEMLRQAVEFGVGCIVLCQAELPEDIRSAAKNTCIISTPYDSYRTVRRIFQAIPVSRVSQKKDLQFFHLTDYIDDVREVVLQSRYRSYPILDDDEKVVGTLSRYHLIRPRRKRVVLVDHNEAAQSVPGLEQTDIIAIIDHHRLADIQTKNPIYFRNEPVGSTTTIVAGMYTERGLMPSAKLAGLMAAAIVSDTVMFKSPTSTPRDKQIFQRLAHIAGISLEELGREIFSASAPEDKPIQELLFTDFKEFHIAGHDFGVSQITCVDSDRQLKRKDEFLQLMAKTKKEHGYSMMILMLTDVLLEGTKILCLGGEDTFQQAFNVELKDHEAFLPRVMSRKKQVIPMLSALWGLGVKNAVMLTGDSPRTATAIAKELGVDDFRAGVLPADKADYVSALRREGHTVLMVGDGINDSPALSEADAGIAISDGAAIAREIADITIAADSLWELVRLRQLAMALMNRIQNNYRFVIGFNGALIGLGIVGILPPATSAMLHNLSTLGVSLHSMSALPVAGQATKVLKDL